MRQAGEERSARALSYPFDVAKGPFVWTARGCRPLGHAEPVPLGGRVPVLAYGSNAAPSQLDRKFADPEFSDPGTPDGCIPLLRAIVPDVDVVYSAHVARYGSIPATLCRKPGTLLTSFVSWLTPRQRARMDETEGTGVTYRLRELAGARWERRSRAGREGRSPDLDSGPVLAYVSIRGCARPGGDVLGVAGLAAPDGALRRVDQGQIWDRVAAGLQWGGDGAALCRGALVDGHTWRAVDAFLAADAVIDP